MDTISQRTVQGLERAEKQSCLHVVTDRQTNGSCGLLGTISFSLEGLLVFSRLAYRRIPFALTALSLTLLTLSLSFCFSCSLQIIGRVNADPDYLPRAMDFGLNVSGFLEHYCPPNCPRAFFPVAAVCCDLDADKRLDLYNRFTMKSYFTNIKIYFLFIILGKRTKFYCVLG